MERQRQKMGGESDFKKMMSTFKIGEMLNMLKII